VNLTLWEDLAMLPFKLGDIVAVRWIHASTGYNDRINLRVDKTYTVFLEESAVANYRRYELVKEWRDANVARFTEGASDGNPQRH
jgi:hypothetical protein